MGFIHNLMILLTRRWFGQIPLKAIHGSWNEFCVRKWIMFYSIINSVKENICDILIKSICSFMRTISIRYCEMKLAVTRILTILVITFLERTKFLERTWYLYIYSPHCFTFTTNLIVITLIKTAVTRYKKERI